MAQIKGANNRLMNVGVVYRPPDQKAVVDDLMYNRINHITPRNYSTVIMSDFNLLDINLDNLDVHSYYNN